MRNLTQITTPSWRIGDECPLVITTTPTSFINLSIRLRELQRSIMFRALPPLEESLVTTRIPLPSHEPAMTSHLPPVCHVAILKVIVFAKFFPFEEQNAVFTARQEGRRRRLDNSFFLMHYTMHNFISNG